MSWLKIKKPLFAVEAKTQGKNTNPAISYFAAKTPIPKFYQVHLGSEHFSSGKTTVLPFSEFCKEEGV